jgi:hypothetical protein
MDSLLVSLPFVLCVVLKDQTPQAVEGYVITLFVIQALVVLFPQDMHKRYYGMRFGLPILFSCMYAFVCWYWSVWEPPDRIVRYFGLCGSVGLGMVLAVCVTDLGFTASTSLRHGLERISDETFLRVTVMVMLSAVSVLPIWFSVQAELSFGYIHIILILGLVFMSILASQHQKGSIVSAALSAYCITSVHVGVLPTITAVVFSTVCNSFYLNRSRKDVEMLPDLPLLDDSAVSSPLSSDETLNVRFKYVCHNLILVSYFSQGSNFDPEAFFLSSTLSCVWILIAPFVLTNRYFPS